MRNDETKGPLGRIVDGISSMFVAKPKEVFFVKFIDSSGNFELLYPKGWVFDHDIAIVDARYTISFCSPDSQSTFTIAVDANLPSDFKFKEYAKRELEGPCSGIYTKAERGGFKGMPAYLRDFTYRSGGRAYFGGGVMFCSGDVVFSISYNAPESRRAEMEAIFCHMKERFQVRQGFVMTDRRKKITS